MLTRVEIHPPSESFVRYCSRESSCCPSSSTNLRLHTVEALRLKRQDVRIESDRTVVSDSGGVFEM